MLTNEPSVDNDGQTESNRYWCLTIEPSIAVKCIFGVNLTAVSALTFEGRKRVEAGLFNNSHRVLLIWV
jgi:hypothetical protein